MSGKITIKCYGKTNTTYSVMLPSGKYIQHHRHYNEYIHLIHYIRITYVTSRKIYIRYIRMEYYIYLIRYIRI